ncbi:MAG TPA: hypothetical protein ENK52_00865, partial [Saprospiraceae bacterium]|nr:hypothetical protein [Saprospiraceae bacterium]
MKFLRLTFITLVLLCFLQSTFGQTNYKQRYDISGYFQPAFLSSLGLESKATEVVNTLPSTFQSEFKVYGFGYYIQTEFFNSGDDYQAILDASIAEALTAEPTTKYCLFIGKKSTFGEIYTDFKIDLALPSTGAYSIVTPTLEDVIEKKVLKAMRDKYDEYDRDPAYFAEAEKAGMNTLIEYLEMINSGNLPSMEDLLLDDGFIEMHFEEVNIDDSGTGNMYGSSPTAGQSVFDYAGLKITGDPQYLSSHLEVAMSETEQNIAQLFTYYGLNLDLSIATVLTDEANTTSGTSPNTEFEQARVFFNNHTDHKAVVWLHYIPDANNGGKIFYKSKENFTLQEAGEILDVLYTDFMEPNAVPSTFAKPGGNNKSKKGGGLKTQGEVCYNESNAALNFLSKWQTKDYLLPKIDNSELFSDGGTSGNLFTGTLMVTGAPHLSSQPNGGVPEDVSKFGGGFGVGFLDGLLGTIKFMYDASAATGAFIYHIPDGLNGAAPGLEMYKSVIKELILRKVVTNKSYTSTDEEYWKSFSNKIKTIGSVLNSLWNNGLLQSVDKLDKFVSSGIDKMYDHFFTEGDACAGYYYGMIAFEAAFDIVTGGTGNVKSISSVSKRTADDIADIAKSIENIDDLSTSHKLVEHIEYAKPISFGSGVYPRTATTMKNAISATCKKGCFVAGTKVKGQYKKRPIESFVLGQKVYANKWVNATIENLPEEGSRISKDPYTSIDQRKIDATVFENSNWYSVSMELCKEDGSVSTVHLLRPNWWIQKNKIQSIGDKVWIDMPEMNTQGYATITSLAHYRKTKNLDEEPNDKNYVFQPITGIFVHQSNDVWNLIFDNGDTLGVTSSHPIYSSDQSGWVLVDDLFEGENVLTKNGIVQITCKEKVEGDFTVYNLEIREEHNYLVGEVEVIVHNTYYKGLLLEALSSPTAYARLKEGDPIRKLAELFHSGSEGAQKVIKFLDDVTEIKIIQGKSVEVVRPELFGVWSEALMRNLPTDLGFLKPFAKALSEKPKIDLHLSGHINSSGNAVGCHLSSAIDNLKVRLKDSQPTGLPTYYPNGSLKKAAIEINDGSGNWIPKAANSTFFPSGWTNDKILNEIAYVRSKASNKVNNRKWRGF